MIATLVISITTFILIGVSLFFFPKVKIGKISLSTYWMIAMLGAIILIACSLAPIKEVWAQLTSDSKINPLKILVLFFSMTFISIVLDELGLFKHLASVAVKKAKGSQYALFFALYGLASLLTIFTSNDIVILTMTPFICFFCKRGKINPLPYLIGEFAAANTWSLMFIIGNPTNINLGTSAGISFTQYFKVMALPCLIAGLVELIIIFLLFRKLLSKKISIDDQDIEHIENKTMLFVGIAHLAVCLIFLVISGYINVEMWLISLICAGSLLLFIVIYSLITRHNWKYLINSSKRLPYPLIPFFLSMFVIVVAFNYQGISIKIAELLGNKNIVFIYGYTSFISSNIINNIPMSILYSNLASGLTGLNYKLAIYSSIIGSNIGAFLTPLGALAGIMFTTLVNKYEVKFSFIDFVKYGVIISIPTISAALGMLLLTIRF